MQVSVSKQGTLGRKLSIEVPEAKILERQEKRLQKVAQTAKMDGFRKGKVPMKIVKERYGPQVRHEILGDIIQSTLIEALSQEKLVPAGMPHISETDYQEGKPLRYVAEFEIYPEVELKSFEKLKIEQLKAEVSDADVAQTLETIRGQYKDWQVVERVAKAGDQVDINFTGSLNGTEFAGGKAEYFKLELGANKMIPGFEEGIVGMKAGEEKVIKVTFPQAYGEASLAGKEADFNIKVNAVEEAKLPEINTEFAERLGIKDGSVEQLRAEVRKNMQRELDAALSNDTKHKVFEALIEQNKVDVPKALIDREIEHMQKQAEKMYGQHMSLEGLKDKSNDLFEKEASRRVALGLLVSEVIKKNELKVDSVRVRKMIEEIAEAYEKPQEVINMYYGDKNRLANIESLVLEEMVVEKIMADAKVSDKKTNFSDVIKPQK